MSKNITLGILATTTAIGLGFLVGFAVGQETRKALPGTVSADYNQGKLVISADLHAALNSGINGFISSIK